MATSDWRDVYGQECRRPGYVIENGRSVEKIPARIRAALRPRAVMSAQGRVYGGLSQMPTDLKGYGVPNLQGVGLSAGGEGILFSP